MNHLLSLLLFFLTSAIAVHSAPPSSTSTTTKKKFLRRRTQSKPKSNDDPVKLNFDFSIQSTTPPPSNLFLVADALQSFGETLFDTSEEYTDRFMWFMVDPLSSSPVTVVAEARGSWRHLEEEQSYTSSFAAELTLGTSRDVYTSDTEEEDAKQFFLNALNSGAVGGGSGLGSLLGSWTAVEYVAPVVETHSTGAEEVLPADNGGEENSSLPAAANNAADKTSITDAESPNTNNDAGEINNNVIGIAFAVFGACLVAFLFFAYAHRMKRRSNNAEAEDHIGDLHVAQDENDKPAGAAGKWAGLLPARIKSNKNASGTSASAAAPVEVNEIDKVLADLHDSDDSSFVSAVSSADETSFSGYSGMTGISDLNYQPKNKEPDESKLEKVEEMKPSISFLDQSKGSLLKGTGSSTQGMKKDASFDSDPSDPSKGSSLGTAQSVRKEESFESDYRDKSAMATLNLKKDMLNTGLGENEKAQTISAHENATMLQQQRQVDKVRAATVKAKKRMKSVGSSSRKGDVSLSPSKKVVETELDESREQLLPLEKEKSDDLNLGEIV